MALCSEFGCFQRIFPFVFVPWCVYTVFAVSAMFASPHFHKSPQLSRYDLRRWRIVFGFLFFAYVLAYSLLVLFPVACDSNPQLLGCYWTSPVGGSSCTRQSGVAQTYNADGALLPPQTAFTADMICVIRDATFAPGNGLSVLTYPPIPGTTYPDTSAPPCPTSAPCLATNRSQDYPNPALGIVGGLFFLNQSASVGLCPGNRVADAQVVGLNVCPACLPCWRRSFGFVDARYAHCTQPTTTLNCAFWCDSACPFVGEVRTRFAVLVEFAVVLALGFTPILEWIAEEL